MYIMERFTQLLFKWKPALLLLLVLCYGLAAFAQQAQTISGRVTGDTGENLPGVTILVKGTNIGTASDIEGNYTLQVPAGSNTLVVSFVGYQTQEVVINNQATVNINLATDAKALQEVVVVGYGTQEKVNLTGAVAVVSAKELENRPVTNASSALQGLAPGLTAVSPSGFPGASGANLRIRGIGTLNNADPFIVIDGIPDVDINSINPEDIESVSVLKDAASASIYGSRAANGVILITTKTGKANQKPTLSYNGYVGVQTPTALPKMLGSAEYMEMLNESQRNVNLPLTYTDEQIQIAREGTDPNYFANTDWSKALIKDYAPQQNHNVSLNGGTSDLSYYASYGRLNQAGLVVGDQYKATRNNTRLRLTSKNLLDLIDLDANLNYIDREQNQPAGGTDHNTGPIYTTLTMSPLDPVRFENGTWGYGGGSSNPVAIATDGGYNNFTSQEFYGSLSGTIHLLKNLDLRAQYGLNAINQFRSTFSRKIDYFYPESGQFWYTNRTDNQLENRDYQSRKGLLSGQLNYGLNLGKHDIKVLLGYQQEEYRYDSWYASKMGFVSDDVPVFNLGTIDPRATGDAYQWALRSYFGRLNYSFDNKYLLEFNARYDGSSRYLPGRQYGFFPSGSVGWRFTQEDFFNNAGLTWLNEGKIRVSYGDLGGQYGANGVAYSEWYPYIPVLTSIGTMPIGNVLTTGLAQQVLANPFLEWETASMGNIGIDLGFFNNKLTFTGDIFDRRTKNIQLRVPQPDILGLEVPDQNAGEVSNKGWEVSLGWREDKNTFKYGFTAQLSDVRNKVVDLGGAPATIADRIRQVGYPIDAYYGYRTDGLAQVDDFKTNDQGVLVPKFPIFDADAGKVGPGDIKFRDLDGDGKITADKDRAVIGDAFPRYTYSLRGDFAYKGLDLSLFLQGVGKANGYISGPGIHTFYTNGAFPQEVHRDHWTPENPDAWYPRFTYSDARNSTMRMSDYWLQNAAYLRLKNIQLGYTIPQQLLSKFRVDHLRVYVSAENLLTKSKYFYAYDPETAGAGSDATVNGGMYPQVKTFVFGVNFRFK